MQDSEIARQFIIDLSGAIPQHGSCESTIDNVAALPVVFLFKFEDVNSHNISFNWTVGWESYKNSSWYAIGYPLDATWMQENPFAHLNLTGYACQELQVSFAVGNVAGLSNFSQKATIKVNMS